MLLLFVEAVNVEYVDVGCNYDLLFLKKSLSESHITPVVFKKSLRESPITAVYTWCHYIIGCNNTKMWFNTAVVFCIPLWYCIYC